MLNDFHHVSLKRAIQCLRQHNFSRSYLVGPVSEEESTPDKEYRVRLIRKRSMQKHKNKTHKACCVLCISTHPPIRSCIRYAHVGQFSSPVGLVKFVASVAKNS